MQPDSLATYILYCFHLIHFELSSTHQLEFHRRRFCASIECNHIDPVFHDTNNNPIIYSIGQIKSIE